MSWDFSLGNVGATIADVLKSRSDSEAQQSLGQAQIAASSAQQTTALAIAANNQKSLQFLIVAVVIALIGYQLAKRA